MSGKKSSADSGNVSSQLPFGTFTELDYSLETTGAKKEKTNTKPLRILQSINASIVIVGMFAESRRPTPFASKDWESFTPDCNHSSH